MSATTTPTAVKPKDLKKDDRVHITMGGDREGDDFNATVLSNQPRAGRVRVQPDAQGGAGGDERPDPQTLTYKSIAAAEHTDDPVLEGVPADETPAPPAIPGLTAEEAAEYRALTAGTGRNGKEQKRLDHLHAKRTDRSNGAAKKKGAKKGDGGSKRVQYPDEIREASKTLLGTFGRNNAPGPKQHVAVRNAVGDRDPLEASGFASFKALKAYADGTGGTLREQTDKAREAMGALYVEAGKDPFARGRHMAQILVVWIEQRKAAKKP